MLRCRLVLENLHDGFTSVFIVGIFRVGVFSSFVEAAIDGDEDNQAMMQTAPPFVLVFEVDQVAPSFVDHRSEDAKRVFADIFRRSGIEHFLFFEVHFAIEIERSASDER